MWRWKSDVSNPCPRHEAVPYYVLDRKSESDAALADFVAKYQADAGFQIAEMYAFRGETDRAFEWLERAYS